MFKKRKEKKARELNDQRLAVKNKFKLALQEAEKLEDPAEKVIALQELSKKVGNQIWAEEVNVLNKASESFRNTTMGGSMAVFAGGVTGAVLVTGPLAPVVVGAALAGYGGAMIVGGMRAKSVKKKLAQSATPHLGELRDILTVVDKLRDQTVENNADAISASPLREKVLALPGISERFAAASARQLAENAKLVEEAKKIIAAGSVAKNAEEPRLSGKPTPRLIKPSK